MIKVYLIIFIFKSYYLYKYIKNILFKALNTTLLINYTNKNNEIRRYKHEIFLGEYTEALKEFMKIYKNNKRKSIFSISTELNNYPIFESKKILIVGGANYKYKTKIQAKYDYCIYINQIDSFIEKNNKFLDNFLFLNGNAVKRLVTSPFQHNLSTIKYFVKTNNDMIVLKKYFSFFKININCYVVPIFKNNLTYGTPDAGSVILMSLLAQKPDSIYVLGMDLFTSLGRRESYISSHQIYSKNDISYKKRVNLSFSRGHCPFSIFLNMKELYSKKVFKTDSVLSKILQKNIYDYSFLLFSLYSHHHEDLNAR